MSSGTETRGHLSASGGLRGHSVGQDYPWSIVGRGYEGWQAVNLETGQEYPIRDTYAEAQDDLDWEKR